MDRHRGHGIALKRMALLKTGAIPCKRCNIEAASCLVGDVAVCGACKQKNEAARMRSAR
jgi:hypothetical protein